MPDDLVEPASTQPALSVDPIAAVVDNVARPRRRRAALIEWVIILVVAVGVSLLMRAYVVQQFYIPTGSMEPTLPIGDRVLVSKLSVTFGTIHRGDIVVFHAPKAALRDCSDAVPIFIKRVIGLPGDHLTSRGNTIYVNGQPLDQTWTHYEPLGTPIGNVTVPANSYFVMGDNQSQSCDSRTWGTVPRSSMIGKAFFRLWPLSHFGFL